MRTVHRDAALAGVDLLAQSPLAGGLRGLTRAIQGADDRLLCAAVRACTTGNSVLGILLLQRAPHEPEILRTLMVDEMWDRWVRVGGFAPVLGMGGEAAIAINVVQYLVIPGWAEGLERYQALMDTLLAQPAVCTPRPAATHQRPTVSHTTVPKPRDRSWPARHCAAPGARYGRSHGCPSRIFTASMAFTPISKGSALPRSTRKDG
ncbi:hypothetical protein ACFY2M_40050 [Streptomyces sp. NPDC001276]|uniref:hypothetical protein n=1 Tax=Streptomyces sp. NPDC001276 TaxID=3364555 RepID=UPI0036858258